MRSLLVRLSATILITTISFLSASSAFAALPADAAPESASIVIRWKSPQTSWGKLTDFIEAVQPGFGAIVKNYLPSTGMAFSNEGLQGVDLTQDMSAIIFCEPDSAPSIVFVVTASDVEELKKGLGEDLETHVSGKLVAYSEDKDALTEV